MGLYLTPAAVSYMTQVILTAIISGYFILQLRESHRASHNVWLTAFFIVFTLFLFSLFLEAALLPTPRLTVVFLQNALLGVALICLLQFAYHFPMLPTALRGEALFGLFASSLYTLWEAGYAVYRFAQLSAGMVLYRPAAYDYLLLALFLWVPVAFMRQFRYMTAGSGTHWYTCLRRPPTRTARAVRNFALIFLGVASLNLFNILSGALLISRALASMGLAIGILGGLLLFAVTYLNVYPKATSFMIKLAGVTLTVILGILSGVSWVVAPAYAAQYHAHLPDHRTLHFTPGDNGGYTITESPFTFETNLGMKLPLGEDAEQTCSRPHVFAFPFYGQMYSQIYICNDGTLSLGHTMPYKLYQYRYGADAPVIFALLTDLYPEISTGGVFVREEAERLIVTWDHMRGFSQQSASFTFQASLYPDGAFDLTYNGLPEAIAFYADDNPGASPWAIGALPEGRKAPPQYIVWENLPIDGGPTGVIQDFNLEFRLHLHKLLLPLSELILVLSIFMGGGFPALFYFSLVAPINALLQGVRRIEVGDYSEPVPVQTLDEIGFLTRAFNALTAALGDMVHTLEAQVQARTAALNKANAQLRAEITESEQAHAALVEQQRALATFEERDRMSRELHDGLGQTLGYINVQAQAIESLLKNGQAEDARNNLHQLAYMARNAQSDLRQYILGLRAPDGAPHPEFVTALRARLRRFQTRYGVAPHLSLPPDLSDPLFAPAIEEQALRIIQESLTNIGKHANASYVAITLDLIDDQAQIIISDDGIGFDINVSGDAASLQMTEHFGLQIMRERAEQAGGRLEIRSVPGKGTQIIALLPRFPTATAEDDLAQIKGLRLLLADDHPLFLDGLRNLLTARGLTIVGTARNGNEALEKTRDLHPDVVLIDVKMPECNGLEATRRIKTELPDVKVVLLTASENDADIFEAIKNGASGYLLKSLEANQFCSLLVGLMRGEVALAPGLAQRILTEFAILADSTGSNTAGEEELLQPQIDSHAEATAEKLLTSRQLEILHKVNEGLTYKEIALELHLSEQTIKYHMAQILERLHLESRAQASAYLKSQKPS
ncbi:MAG: hybrid sensor histidine kinase/response regulator transcription factor [Anaerolineae bacterium]|nr:hybrid sensor histidine kinase/response regulator transcription factor [Anaerolineae bacterium]